MNKENKELLLKDLCARLPYGVKVRILCKGPERKFDDWIEDILNTRTIELFGTSFKNIKPYLRPLSAMTEEEASYLSKLKVSYGKDTFKWIYDNLDYLNSRHLDYRNLIEKGLALEAPKDMYKF